MKMTTPEKIQTLINRTEGHVFDTLHSQATHAAIKSGWPDPLPEDIIAAIYTGCGYVMHLGHLAVDSDSISAEEYAAIQGVTELAMQIWKTIHKQTQALQNQE